MFHRAIGCTLTLVMGVMLGIWVPSAPAQAATMPIAPAILDQQTLRQPTTSCTVYHIRTGDWLRRIAQHFGVTWATIYAENRSVIGTDPDRIFPGEQVQICGDIFAANPPTTDPELPTGTRSGEPCQSDQFWPIGPLVTWSTPPGCYAPQYVINPMSFPRISAAFGGCDWWPAVLHPNESIWTTSRHTVPVVGAPILFAPGEQGAATSGHWGVVVAISPNRQVVLSAEMNSTIFGRFSYAIGGWGRVIPNPTKCFCYQGTGILGNSYGEPSMIGEVFNRIWYHLSLRAC